MYMHKFTLSTILSLPQYIYWQYASIHIKRYLILLRVEGGDGAHWQYQQYHNTNFQILLIVFILKYTFSLKNTDNNC